MDRIVVVGSGASGVHYALTALEKGHHVTLLDVGWSRAEPPHREAAFLELHERLDDPVSYFLGGRGEGVVYPGSRPTYYGFPPSKAYVFQRPESFTARSRGFEPSFSFARGGLAEAWTAGAYVYGDAFLSEFPVEYAELRPHYQTVVKRIGICGAEDELARFIPFDAEYLPPLPPDGHTRLLLERYARRKALLARRYNFHMGRSRVATLSVDRGTRGACAQLGRCLWGCPVGALYSPRDTLDDCLRHPRFEYRSGLLVTHFEFGEGGRVEAVTAEPLDGGEPVRIELGRLVLAAGALCSTKILLDSIFRRSGRIEVAGGLMDNRQVHVPFLTLGLIGTEVDTSAYQFHQIAFGVDRGAPARYVHGQITTLKAASLHPILQSLPMDLRSALSAFQRSRAGLGVANVNLPDSRREASRVTIQPSDGVTGSNLVLDYVPDSGEEDESKSAVRTIRRALRRLGCLPVPGMTRTLPKGNSVHYAGTLPMTASPRPFATAPDGRSWDFPNLYVVDGAVLPALPAINHTLTLMANATRVAEKTLD